MFETPEQTRDRLHVAPLPRNNGAASDPEQRWEQITRLLNDEDIDLTDRLAGCLLLLYGKQLSRIAVMTTDQITDRDGTVSVRFGRPPTCCAGDWHWTDDPCASWAIRPR